MSREGSGTSGFSVNGKVTSFVSSDRWAWGRGVINTGITWEGRAVVSASPTSR